MNKKFMIHSCPGTGNMFLTSVFAKLMNIPINTTISSVGDCHDMGRGVWKAIDGVRIAHIFDHDISDIKLFYQPGVSLYVTHVVTPEFMNAHPDIDIVWIGADPADYRDITMLSVKKGWPNLWTEEEYNKWVSPSYPPYSPNNIAESEIICRDLIDDFTQTKTAHWYKENSCMSYPHVIEFKTIMGLNDKDLVEQVASITGGIITNDVRNFVHEYQTINKQLYFNDR